MSTTSNRFGALAGFTAAAVAIGTAELVAVLTGPRSAPLVAVGGVVVDTVPEPLKQFAIDVFGRYDKIALLIGTAVLLGAFAALIGVLAFRRLAVGLAGIGAFAVVGVAAALTRPDAGPATVLPSLVGAALGAGVLWAFTVGPLGVDPWPAPTIPPRTADETPPTTVGPTAAGFPPAGSAAVGPEAAAGPATAAPSPPASAGPGPTAAEPMTPPPTGPGAGDARSGAIGSEAEQLARMRRFAASRSDAAESREEGRRRFLTGAGVLLGAAVVSGLGGHWLAGRRGVSVARSALTLPTPAVPAPPVPPGAELAVPQLNGYVTPNFAFYRIDTALVLPQVDPATWELRIHGRVRNPITLSFADLLARPMVEKYITLACVSNEVGGDLIGNARWLGVPIKDLLDEAEPFDGADQVVGRSADGWTCGTPTAALRDGRDALLAVGMNGEPLPIRHGFPVRMVVPGLYGYVSACKWVVELELTSFADFDAYWVPRGWSAQGPIKTQSRIDAPRSGNRVRPGPVTVAGVAWAQHRGIRSVEVRVDEEPWQQARLAETVSVDTWVQWSWPWTATAGEHTLQVRATDATGETQTGELATVDPDGATGWHTIRVTVE